MTQQVKALGPAGMMGTLLSALNACIMFKFLKISINTFLHQKKIKVFLNNYFNDGVATFDLTFLPIRRKLQETKHHTALLKNKTESD